MGSSTRQILPGAQKARAASASLRRHPRPDATAAIALALALLAALCGAAGTAGAWEAPLDTLETVDAPPPWIPRDIQISRNILPEITGSALPATQPPQRPPRLDDPIDAASQFHLARRALANGSPDVALAKLRQASARDPRHAAYPWWRTWHALRRWDLDFMSALPLAVRATYADLAAWKRLQLLGHGAAVLWLALFWTLLAAAYLFRYGAHVAHDLAARFLRDERHVGRPWMVILLLAGLLLLRPGWLILLTLLSIPLYLHASARARLLLATVWLATAAAVYPGWAPLRSAVPAVDPASESVLLSRADVLPPSPRLVQDLERRLSEARSDPARTARLRLALGILAARAGDYEASSRLFAAAVRQDPANIPAVVNLANNDYYHGRYDAAVRGYLGATRVDPDRAEVQYNLAQAYAKKLFFRESSDALAKANALGFMPPPFEDRSGAANGFTPVVYLGHDRANLEACARWEADRYPALAHLSAWTPWLGEHTAWLFWTVLGGLIVAVASGIWLPASRRCRPCANCAVVVCPQCGGVRDDELLCHTCQGTAERARSDLILATLLKNRSRDQELTFISRAQRFNRLVPGASNLVAGSPLIGLLRLALLASALTLILFGWSFNLMATWDLPGLLLPEETFHALLLPLPAAAWAGPHGWSLWAGLLLAASLYATAWLGHESFRRRRPSLLPKQVLKVDGWRPPAAVGSRDSAQGR